MPVSHSKIPYWKLLKPEKDTSLSEFKKTETNPLVFKQTGIEIYTDGSKEKNKVAAAAVINKNVFYNYLLLIIMHDSSKLAKNVNDNLQTTYKYPKKM